MKRALCALHLIEFVEFDAKYGNMISLIGHHVTMREAIYWTRQWKTNRTHLLIGTLIQWRLIRSHSKIFKLIHQSFHGRNWRINVNSRLLLFFENKMCRKLNCRMYWLVASCDWSWIGQVSPWKNCTEYRMAFCFLHNLTPFSTCALHLKFKLNTITIYHELHDSHSSPIGAEVESSSNK